MRKIIVASLMMLMSLVYGIEITPSYFNPVLPVIFGNLTLQNGEVIDNSTDDIISFKDENNFTAMKIYTNSGQVIVSSTVLITGINENGLQFANALVSIKRPDNAMHLSAYDGFYFKNTLYTANVATMTTGGNLIMPPTSRIVTQNLTVPNTSYFGSNITLQNGEVLDNSTDDVIKFNDENGFTAAQLATASGILTVSSNIVITNNEGTQGLDFANTNVSIRRQDNWMNLYGYNGYRFVNGHYENKVSTMDDGGNFILHPTANLISSHLTIPSTSYFGGSITQGNGASNTFSSTTINGTLYTKFAPAGTAPTWTAGSDNVIIESADGGNITLFTPTGAAGLNIAKASARYWNGFYINTAGLWTFYSAGATAFTMNSTGINAGGYIGLKSRTTAELQAITPTAVGQMYYNSDTTSLYISTGTTAYGFGKVALGATD